MYIDVASHFETIPVAIIKGHEEVLRAGGGLWRVSAPIHPGNLWIPAALSARFSGPHSVRWELSVGRVSVCLHRADPFKKHTHTHFSAGACRSEVNPANVRVSSHSRRAVLKVEGEENHLHEVTLGGGPGQESVQQPIDNGNVSHGICHFKGRRGGVGRGACITVAFSALHCQEGIRPNLFVSKFECLCCIEK